MKKLKVRKLVTIIMLIFIIFMTVSQVCFALDTTRYTEIYEKPAGADSLINKGRKNIRYSSNSRGFNIYNFFNNYRYYIYDIFT